MEYLTIAGDTVTYAQIKAACDIGTARLVHTRTDGGTRTGLSLDMPDTDTRGECFSVWEEVWTTVPRSAAQARQLAN